MDEPELEIEVEDDIEEEEDIEEVPEQQASRDTMLSVQDRAKAKAEEYERNCGGVWKEYRACLQVSAQRRMSKYHSSAKLNVFFVSQTTIRKQSTIINLWLLCSNKRVKIILWIKQNPWMVVVWEHQEPNPDYTV